MFQSKEKVQRDSVRGENNKILSAERKSREEKWKENSFIYRKKKFSLSFRCALAKRKMKQKCGLFSVRMREKGWRRYTVLLWKRLSSEARREIDKCGGWMEGKMKLFRRHFCLFFFSVRRNAKQQQQREPNNLMEITIIKASTETVGFARSPSRYATFSGRLVFP